MGLFGQAVAGAAASSLAKRNRDFTLMMSNTAYQRAVMDLKAAGLNPMLAYTQGGASAPAMSATAGVGAGGPALEDITSAQKAKEEVALLKKQGATQEALREQHLTQSVVNRSVYNKNVSAKHLDDSHTLLNSLKVPGARNEAGISKSVFGEGAAWLNRGVGSALGLKGIFGK